MRSSSTGIAVNHATGGLTAREQNEHTTVVYNTLWAECTWVTAIQIVSTLECEQSLCERCGGHLNAALVGRIDFQVVSIRAMQTQQAEALALSSRVQSAERAAQHCTHTHARTNAYSNVTSTDPDSVSILEVKLKQVSYQRAYKFKSRVSDRYNTCTKVHLYLILLSRNYQVSNIKSHIVGLLWMSFKS